MRAPAGDDGGQAQGAGPILGACGSAFLPSTFGERLHSLLVDLGDWKGAVHWFYRLLRHLVVAQELPWSEA